LRLALLGGLAVAVLVAGCGDRSAHAIDGNQAVMWLQRATGVRLHTVPPIDVGAFANVTSTYAGTGPTGTRVLLVVFDSEAARSQMTGGDRSPAPPGAAIVQRDNLVVFVSGPGRGAATKAARRALSGLSA
jgi:hypothetical protein